MRRAALLLWLCSAPGFAVAEVVAKSSAGFVSQHELVVAATPQEVYRTLTDEVHRWWDPAHSFSGKAENFYIEARALGCFCERLPDGGTVAHMQVLFAQPGVLLRLGGGLGPLQTVAASGSMDFALTAVPEGTRLRYRYVVSGFDPNGIESWAEPVDQVQLGQLRRLQQLFE